MIVDCHTHITCLASKVDIAEHLEACEKIDACFVLAVRQGGNAEANQQVSDYAKQYRKMIGFGVVNPLEDKIAAKSVRTSIVDRGLTGTVLYCCQEKFHPAHSRAMRFYESAEELGLVVFFHNSMSFGSDAIMDYAQPYLLDEIAIRFPSLKIIIGGMGLPFVSQTLCLLAKHENVYADMTISPRKVWEVYNLVVSAYEAGVMDKLLFGSGYPTCLPGNCMETLLGFNKLLADTNLPAVPRERLRSIVERDTLTLLGISLP